MPETTMLGWHCDPLTRLKARADRVGDCLIVRPPLSRKGYARISVDGRKVQAHRYVYERANGPLAPGMVPDHTCRNRACIELAHLEAVTNQENVKRGVRFWEKCPHGDAYRYARNRTCNVCRNERRRQLYAQRRAAA